MANYSPLNFKDWQKLKDLKFKKIIVSQKPGELSDNYQFPKLAG